MSRNTDPSLLKNAKLNKNDEFYTQYCDIESELKHYGDHFRNKVVYCNCDDPRVSNFFKYFMRNFGQLGIKRIVATCYKKQRDGLFDTGEKSQPISYEYSGDANELDELNPEKISYLSGDGDFRSVECQEILKQSDIVVTNPPFSLFREFVDQLIRLEKKFLVIGNINAITYKEIFKLIQADQAWLGINLGRGISGFIVPEHYELYGTEARLDESGNRIVSSNNCLWLTNLDIPKRHDDIPLIKSYQKNPSDFPVYDNYDGINVDKTKDIPFDFAGAIGVPITFLHKFNPEQFEIIRFRKGDDGKDLRINGRCPYFRILVRNKRVSLEKHSQQLAAPKTDSRLNEEEQEKVVNSEKGLNPEKGVNYLFDGMGKHGTQ